MVCKSPSHEEAEQNTLGRNSSILASRTLSARSPPCPASLVGRLSTKSSQFQSISLELMMHAGLKKTHSAEGSTILSQCSSLQQTIRFGVLRKYVGRRVGRQHGRFGLQDRERHEPKRKTRKQCCQRRAKRTVDIFEATAQVTPPMPRRVIDSIDVPAFRRSLLAARDHHSFVRNVDLTIQYINPDVYVSEDIIIPEQIARLTNTVDEDEKRLRAVDAEYRGESVWKDVSQFLKLLEDSLYHVKSAMGELRQYIPAPAMRDDRYRRTPSLESLESIVSEKEACAHLLKVAVQRGYEVIQERFTDSLRLVTAGLHGEPPMIDVTSTTCISCASQAIALLESLVCFETETHGLDRNQFALTIEQQILKGRQQSLVDMFHALCRYLMCLHESLFLTEHLFAKGLPSIQKLKSMATIMKRCWTHTRDIMKRMTHACPMFKEVAHEYFGRALWHAASLMAKMQDVDDVQAFLEHAKIISYNVEIVRDVVKGQLWLLPCLEQIHSLISKHVPRLQSKLTDGTSMSQRRTQLLRDLRKVMYDLVMMTLARASWLSSYPETPYLRLGKDIRDQGTLAFVLVSKYTRSTIALKCDQECTVEDVSLYSALVCATNELRNAILPLHDLVQRHSCISEEPESKILSPNDSIDSGCIMFHEVPCIRRLKTDISIKPYPVTMDGSIEFETALNAIEAEEKTLQPSSSSKNWMISPWEMDMDSSVSEDEEEKEPASSSIDIQPSYEKSKVHSLVSSTASLDLPTDFVDIDASNSGEVDSAFQNGTAPRRESMRDSLAVATNKSQSRCESTLSPFETQQPEKLPEAAAAGWGNVNTNNDGTPVEAMSTGIVGVVSSGLVKDVLAVDLIPGPMIGKGSEGHVLKMSYHETPVAVKIMNHTCHRTRERFKNETKLLSKLTPHQNIVNFVGRCTDLKAGEQNQAADLVMVMEFCDLGNLYKIISEAKWICQLHEIGRNLTEFQDCFGYLLYSDWKRRLEVARDIAAGVAHMHHHDIVHRDLTSFNVVLKKGDQGEWIAKICDFERSRFIAPNQTIPRSDNIANSPAWSAPEVLREDPYSVQADVFSLGVILWELWTLEEPWRHPDQEIRNPMHIIPTVGNHGGRLRCPSVADTHYPHLSQLKALIEDCWNEEPSSRPTMSEAHQRLIGMIRDHFLMQ